MARMPEAEWVGEHGSRLMQRYDIVCIHTIVGYAPAHAAQFSTAASGKIFQSRDTRFQSAANLDGNPRIIAIENEDHGPAFGGTPKLPGWVPLTAEQVQSCGKILAWAHKEHGVPLQLCPDSRPGSRGLAYHRQGIDGNFGGYRYPGRVAGGELWTEHYGKVCPTDVRIAQLEDILEVARGLVNPEEDYMASEEAGKKLDRILAILERNNRVNATRWANLRKRDRDLAAAIRDIADADDAALAPELRRRLRRIEAELQEEPEEIPEEGS